MMNVLAAIYVCLHVQFLDCISMERVDSGTEYQNWTTHPNNPMRVDQN